MLVSIWPHCSYCLATKKLRTKCILVSVISPLGVSEMTHLLSLKIYDFSVKGLVPLPYLICVSEIKNLHNLSTHAKPLEDTRSFWLASEGQCWPAKTLYPKKKVKGKTNPQKCLF